MCLPTQLRIDEAVKKKEIGPRRIGETKTENFGCLGQSFRRDSHGTPLPGSPNIPNGRIRERFCSRAKPAPPTGVGNFLKVG